MKKFRLGYQQYLFISIIFIVSLCTTYIFISNSLAVLVYVLVMPPLLVEFYSIINAMFFIRTSVDDKGIGNRKNFIEWDKIDCVYINDGNYIYKHWVTIRSGSKKINITSWFKDYKELIKIVVDECKKRDIKVELMVEKIIED